jgi:hypothetical protein
LTTENEQNLYDELLMMVYHDRKLAERLIEFEKKLSPHSKRSEQIQDAIYRLKRDRK